MSQPLSETDPLLPDGMESVCTEENFKSLLRKRIDELPLLRSAAIPELQQHSRRFLAALNEESSELEEMMDDFGARNNATFFYLGELTASLKGFSGLGHVVSLIQTRFGHRLVSGNPEVDSEFHVETLRTMAFVDQVLRKLIRAFDLEIHQVLGPSAVPQRIPGLEVRDENIRKILPHSLGAEKLSRVDEHIISVMASFQSAVKTLGGRFQGAKFDEVEAMRIFVRDVCNEGECRFFEAKLHNIQSRYDTFVKNTVVENEDPDLPCFRQLVSVSVYLLQSMVLLVHFYERHEDDIRDGIGARQITALVEKDQVLDRLLNYGLVSVYRILNAAAPLVQNVLTRYSRATETCVQLPPGVMIHARPASLMAKIVQHHGMPVQMSMGGESCYAGSIMQILLLAGRQHKIREIRFNGDARPIADLEELFRAQLGEAGMEQLPATLDYLMKKI